MTEFIQGDEISGSCTIRFSLEDGLDPIQDPIEGPGRYVVTWCRWGNNICLWLGGFGLLVLQDTSKRCPQPKSYKLFLFAIATASRG